CPQSFKNDTGCRIHLAKVHAVQAINHRLDKRRSTRNPRQTTNLASQQTSLPSSASTYNDVTNECILWHNKFLQLLSQIESLDPDTFRTNFDGAFSEFAIFLFEVNARLPGPVHPKVTMFR